MNRLWKPLIALGALGAALTLTLVGPRNGLDFDIDGSQRAQAARRQDPEDPAELPALNTTLNLVTHSYVEPERIDLERMFLAGLNAIQRSVPPVIVHYEDGAESLEVQIHEARREFPVAVDSAWRLGARFGQVFTFLAAHLDDEDVDLKEIEYATVNGMLRTLDPHTVLLTPDVYEEMRMSTRGEFGGLGIVISIREGHLTVLRPMPNTPASRSGLLAGDRIVKINDESTLNMPLEEAVSRLRGTPGSEVTCWISRESDGRWSQPRAVRLTRAVIHIDSVESEMLSDGVGYISIDNFQGNTHEDMQRALRELHRQGLRGLILDLRGNPGGLLEQAVLVANTFLRSGTIVSTSSPDPRQRDERPATAAGTEPDYPLVVLVNGSSASASEIVAGALKNHDRALIVGQRSFGKGSVQVLSDYEDGSALKLTIAQYLTPGEVSIQGVGIVPDIGIDPMTVDREDMDLAVDPESYLRESDLRSALTNDRTREAERPTHVLRYYLSGEARQELREADPRDNENEREDEFLTRFAQRLVAQAQRSGPREMLEDAVPVIEAVRDQELQKATEELGRIGVDWAAGTDQGASPVRVEVETLAGTDERPGAPGRAGQPYAIRVRVTNTGEHPLFQLQAATASDYRLFDDRELVFGRVDPGQTREWTTTLGVCSSEGQTRECRLPRDVSDRADGIRIEFSEAHGHAPDAAEVRTTVRALARPQFAYTMQVADDLEGNGDGRIQRGEHGSVFVRVKNVGPGQSFATHANLRNLSGRGVLLRAGRFRIDNMQPGEERLVRFTFEVLEDFGRDEVKLGVSVYDADLRESITEDLEIPLAAAPTSNPSRANGNVTLGEGAILRSHAAADASSIGSVTGGTLSLPRQASYNGFTRVALADEQVAWVADSELSPGAGRGGQVSFALRQRAPAIELASAPDLVTRSNTIDLRGAARDDHRVRDLYIFSGARKVFYLSNGHGDHPGETPFHAEVPLTPGINYVTIFARESDDVVSRRLLVIRRDGPDGALLETPRYDEDVFGSFDE